VSSQLSDADVEAGGEEQPAPLLKLAERDWPRPKRMMMGWGKRGWCCETTNPVHAETEPRPRSLPQSSPEGGVYNHPTPPALAVTTTSHRVPQAPQSPASPLRQTSLRSEWGKPRGTALCGVTLPADSRGNHPSSVLQPLAEAPCDARNLLQAREVAKNGKIS